MLPFTELEWHFILQGTRYFKEKSKLKVSITSPLKIVVCIVPGQSL